MSFEEKIKSDLECMKRILQRLIDNGADTKAIATLEGMIAGAETFVENQNEKL